MPSSKESNQSFSMFDIENGDPLQKEGISCIILNNTKGFYTVPRSCGPMRGLCTRQLESEKVSELNA